MDRQGAGLTERTACMPRTHPTYDTAFRQGAVDLLLSNARPLKRVADDLGISANSLRTWRDLALGKGRGAQAAAAQPPGRSDALFADPASEIRPLQSAKTNIFAASARS
jgi:transposase-like protein